MRSNSTTTKRKAATTPRRKAPTYQTAAELRLTLENETPDIQSLGVARMLAMAEYLLTTPAKGMLAQNLYIACAKAWQHNRQNSAIRINDAVVFEDETLSRNITIRRLIDFVHGEREAEPDIQQDLTRLRLENRTGGFTRPRVVDMDEWKRKADWIKTGWRE